MDPAGVWGLGAIQLAGPVMGTGSPVLMDSPSLPPFQCSGSFLACACFSEPVINEVRWIWKTGALQERNRFLAMQVLGSKSFIIGVTSSVVQTSPTCIHWAPSQQGHLWRIFSGQQVETKGGNQTLGALNTKCIHLIYSDKFSSGYFLYYQTLYPSVKTFVLAE